MIIFNDWLDNTPSSSVVLWSYCDTPRGLSSLKDRRPGGGLVGGVRSVSSVQSRQYSPVAPGLVLVQADGPTAPTPFSSSQQSTTEIYLVMSGPGLPARACSSIMEMGVITGRLFTQNWMTLQMVMWFIITKRFCLFFSFSKIR